jgi:hypothetical protein
VNIPVRYAGRITLACALAMVTAEILRYPHAVRGILSATLVAGLPTFRRALMRQRFLLVWMGGMIGMSVEALFRDAAWLFLPAYFLLVVLIYRFASKSRDFATMTIVGYGLSGSLDNVFVNSGNDPIFGGFYRALYCSVGLTAASIAFLLIPVRKPPLSSRTRPTAYPLRDLLFLGFCACTAVWVGVLTYQYLTSSFIVLMSLTWGVQLCTIRDKSDMVWNLAISCLGLVAAAAFDVMVVFSTNNFGVYLIVYLLAIFSMQFTKASLPKFAPRMVLFTTVTSAGILMVPEPIQSFQGILRIQFSMLAGILLATALWFLDRALRSVEEVVLRTTGKGMLGS